MPRDMRFSLVHVLGSSDERMRRKMALEADVPVATALIPIQRQPQATRTARLTRMQLCTKPLAFGNFFKFGEYCTISVETLEAQMRGRDGGFKLNHQSPSRQRRGHTGCTSSMKGT
jgi:hypothetical protein